MNGAQRGFLLLGSQLGNPDRKPLSHAAMRQLAQRIKSSEKPAENRDLELGDITALGYGEVMAKRILFLLGDDALLEHYLRRGSKAGCVAITRICDTYPKVLRDKLGDEAPAVLWAKGNCDILQMPMIALVGSRDIYSRNRAFASEVGIQAAKQGFALVSGNARGADKIAQKACLENGGYVISVVADELAGKNGTDHILYLNEEDFDVPFSAQRALSRNRVIHALADKTFVAQSSCGMGGTWDGSIKNLQHGWSPVFCFDDGSDAAVQLEQFGAQCIGISQLADMEKLTSAFRSFFD